MLPAALVVLSVAAILFFPSTLVQNKVKSRLAGYLTERFGAGASVGEVRLSLHSISLDYVSIPLDRSGSILRIREIELLIAPFNILRQPNQIERAARQLNVVNPVLILAPAAKSRNQNRTESWLPNLRIPRQLYSVLERFDSLNAVNITDGRVFQVIEGHRLRDLCDLDGRISTTEKGEFLLTAAGHYLGDSSCVLNLTGTVEPRDHRAELQAVLEVAPGELPGVPANLSMITTDGGRISLRLTAADSIGTLRATAAFGGATIATVGGDIRVEPIHASLAQDTVYLEPLTFSNAAIYGDLHGQLILSGDGILQFNGSIHSDDLSKCHEIIPDVPKMDARMDGSVAVAGTLIDPEATATIRSVELKIFDRIVRDLSIELNVDKNRAEVCQLLFRTDEGSVDLSGELRLGKKPVLSADGRIVVEKEVAFLGWKSQVAAVHAHVSGPLNALASTFELFAANQQEIGHGEVSRADSVWIFGFQSPFGSSSMTAQPTASGLIVSANNAHCLIGTLFKEWQSTLQPLRSFDIAFQGDESAGSLDWSVQIAPDSTSLLPRIARDFRFSGRYSRFGSSSLAMNGKWSGTAGKGNPFEGRADVTLDEQILTVSHLFIDAVGEAQGVVDLKNRELDVELDISSLSLSELPIDPALMHRIGLDGTVSGHIHASGGFSDPAWDAHVAMVDGSAFGVPGYWMNLDASGHGLVMSVNSFDLGRDVRKIIGASGNLDVAQGTIAMTAEVGSGRAEDFLLALIGWGGFLSGDLEGRGAVSGNLKSPDIEAELTVRNGELVREIQVDEFTASFRTDVNARGERILRIPKCAFGKTGVYQFSGDAEVVPHKGGEFRAQFEGSGDFLDIVDQLETPFVTHGSQSALRVKFGGTLDHPELIEGELDVTNGHFSYPDATPGLVAADIAIRVAAPGDVESGLIKFSTDNQWVQIRFSPGCADRSDGLKPLIIPTPRICLGVLELETGSDGMPLHLPGLQKPEWYGTYIFGTSAAPVTISGRDTNRLLIAGDAQIVGTRITFPFASTNQGRGEPKPMLPVPRWLVQRLIEAQWNLNVAIGSGDHYAVEITGLKNSELFSSLRTSTVFTTLADYFDHLSIDALLEPGTAPVGMHGCIGDSTFHLNGHVSSTRGKVDYLDQSFSIDYVYADFDETNPMPILEGRAVTMGVDSIGGRTPVYLTMYQIDRETDLKQKRGRLDKVTFVLEGDAGQPPEQILQMLGYQAGNASGKAEQLVASTFARAIGRQWLDPLERRLERWTLLDEIAFSPGGGRSTSIVRQQRVSTLQDSLQSNSAIRFFTGSQVTVGKYVTRDVFVTYTGEIAEGQAQYKDRMGMVHSWNLEYRINPLSRDLVLDLAVEYDEIERKRDESVSLKYTFALEP
jgi:hypothetical protein